MKAPGMGIESTGWVWDKGSIRVWLLQLGVAGDAGKMEMTKKESTVICCWLLRLLIIISIEHYWIAS